MLRIPVLTYHSVNILENSYAQNDHIALSEDLRTLQRLKWTILPLSELLKWHQDEVQNLSSARVVGITFDDGSWFDFHDLEHPVCGMQRSFLNILNDFKKAAETSLASPPHATSFVITSPDAREELDKKGLIGKGWWGDDWWNAAQASGLMDIESHSWDHVHPDLARVAQQQQIKGDFSAVNTLIDCDAQVARSGDYIQQRMNDRRPSLFAYPWGQFSDYMVNEYLPENQQKHGFKAAFTTEPKPMEKSDKVWLLPRFVAGRDWNTPEGLEKILADCL